MKRGENIFKRKDGRWEARYIKGYELSGKIKYGFCYGKTYKEAKEKVTKHKVALLAGKPTPQTGTRHRFAFYCDEWLRLRKSKIRESTYIKYDTVLEKHIHYKFVGYLELPNLWNRHKCRQKEIECPHPTLRLVKNTRYGRDDRIRTCGLCVNTDAVFATS